MVFIKIKMVTKYMKSADMVEKIMGWRMKNDLLKMEKFVMKVKLSNEDNFLKGINLQDINPRKLAYLLVELMYLYIKSTQF